MRALMYSVPMLQQQGSGEALESTPLRTCYRDEEGVAQT
jgi:hypothetical protein